MYTTSFYLVMLVLTPWMASGRPAEESVQTASRDSRQLLLPYYVPVQQPSFQGYGNPLGAMNPEAKLQLLQRLLAVSAAISTANQPSDQSGFKTTPNKKNSDTIMDSKLHKQESAAEVLAALGIRNTADILTPEVFQQIEGRPDMQSIMNTIIQTVTNALIQAIMNQFFG
ncbi:uncharacterized protein LOC116927433 [Daphnia magna]|uniref:Uncharacterized protein n=1 Tax=Daphnia magna TaxID=35525 RepID=A0A164MCH4_9CRUS|nr:uncharacterized protein LOC116927433 [Daphnia magna]KZS04931.1 Uncharacterized protein APZ42_032021 [Daphnia magna]